MDAPAQPVVAFYLFHQNARDPRCSPLKSGTLTRVSIDGNMTNKDPEDLPWRITFDSNSTVGKPPCLVTFGSDPSCTIVLSGANIGPHHCRIYAQLNSGSNMMVIEDASEFGTSFVYDNGTPLGSKFQLKHNHSSAAGLKSISIGPYNFCVELPRLEIENANARRWFFEHEPILVTESILKAQLGRSSPKFEETCQIGQGGAGKIYRLVEKKTGLLFAVKKLPECSTRLAEREVMWTKRIRKLQSPFLAQYYESMVSRVDATVEWWTYMPLYQSNLTDMLPQPLEVLERVMFRMLKAVSTMHESGALHQDIKPDNFFVQRKRPLEVVLGDFGHTVSLKDLGMLKGDCGTDGFAAPERLLQQHTTALDVYSLGVSFFVMIEFEKFRTSPWKECLKKVSVQPPSMYGGLIMRMVAGRPEERPTIQQCMQVVQSKEFNWGLAKQKSRQPVYATGNPCPNSPKARAVRLGLMGGKQSPKKNNAPPVVTTTCFKDRLGQPLEFSTRPNIFAHLVKDTGVHPPAPSVRNSPLNANLLKRDLRRPAKAATHRKSFAHLDTGTMNTPLKTMVEARQHRMENTDRYHVFPRPNTHARNSPLVPVHRHAHTGDVFQPRAQQAQPSNRIDRPQPTKRRRISTRDKLRRGPIRKANIERAFAIGQRATRIYTTTSNMAKCLWYLTAGAVTNTRDIALLSLDAFKLFKDVAQARRAVKHMGPEASVKMGEATRLAAGMGSRGLRFVTPVEYEEERKKSGQLQVAPHSKKLKVASHSKQLENKKETVGKDEAKRIHPAVLEVENIQREARERNEKYERTKHERTEHEVNHGSTTANSE